jgi:hypothetical protein
MEADGTFEMLVSFCQTTCCSIPEDSHLKVTNNQYPFHNSDHHSVVISTLASCLGSPQVSVLASGGQLS